MAKEHFYDHQHHGVEEDYIDMEISSTTYLCYTLPSPPHSHSIEFEFQMFSSKNTETDHIPSPADELFYKGNLLPLHLPPRLQMVETLLRSSPAPHHPNAKPPFNTTTTTTTPLESCNISPATSCYVSGELNAEDYFFKDCQEEDDEEELVEPRSKKSWCKKLKHSSIGLKLKASKAYLKSLFTKSGCSDETSAVSKPKECSGRYWKSGGRKSPSPSPSPSPTPFLGQQQIQRIDGEKTVEEQCGHRRSFSGAIKRRSSSSLSMNKSSSSASSSSCSSSNSSSFSSVNSNGSICVPQILKRSSSVSSDKECSVQGAIAYCKKTQQQQQQVCARKSVSDVEFFLLSESSCRG